MADQVESPKSIDTRSQRSIVDTTVANTWRLSHPYLIINYSANYFPTELLSQTICGKMRSQELLAVVDMNGLLHKILTNSLIITMPCMNT